ncbi:hypothetical protein KCTC52924_03570 [Arenibacter antarcticus]|uniref:DUF2933 domain-containing protein n=1 Tax=Arenibacter antarcticus TaxID=2040469 RepID=A0ABW5VIA7_9FLAO|nr:hypothetical protein [Arenibacter sp. H213]
MKGHWIWMLIGCGLPLLLIFFAPALGFTGYNGLFGFIILMFVFHLLMPHGSHGGHGRHNSREDNNKQHEHGKEKPLAAETKDEHEGHSHH